MSKFNPEERMSFKELFEHPFFSKKQEVKLLAEEVGKLDANNKALSPDLWQSNNIE